MVMGHMVRQASKEGPLWSQWLKTSRRRARQTAVIDAAGGKVWTADAVTREALHFGEALAGFRPGERVAFHLPNGAGWLALFLALQRARLVAIPLDHALPPDGCRELAARFAARALYLDGAFYALPSPAARRSPGCCCFKITSGTGALPKGIACRPEHLLADGRQIIATMKIRPRDVNLGVIPLGHSYGLGNLVLPLILQGTAVVCASHYVPRQLLDWTARYRVSVFPGVPALFRVLATLPRGQGGLAPLRTVISAGAVLAPAVAQAFHDRFGLRIHNFYGSSESGGISYDRTGTASLTGRSVGRPMEGVTVTVRARRVTVASPAVAVRGGCWRLPDYGEWNARGELVLLGRAGQGANIGGRKVHPLEIERALRELPGVTDASVWLWRNGGRDLLAAAVETPQPRALVEQALAARLPAWKVPKMVAVAREFPRTARGKVDLAALKKQSFAWP
ncbi:MAG: class I adenylate-forming enzyme family protein [Verrucomicrobiota bacterium]